MNPMAAMAVGAFLSKFPGIASLLTKFPNFKSETKDLLLSYGKLLSESDDPEALLIETLEHALKPKMRTVTVIEVKESKTKKR